MILDNFEKNLFFAHVLPKFRLSRGSCPYNSETLQWSSFISDKVFIQIRCRLRWRSFCRQRVVTNNNEVKQWPIYNWDISYMIWRYFRRVFLYNLFDKLELPSIITWCHQKMILDHPKSKSNNQEYSF